MLPPLTFENLALSRCRPLLVQTRPGARTDRVTNLVENREREMLRPQRFAFPTPAFIVFGDRRQTQDRPVLAGVLLQQPAREVQLVPPRAD